MKNLKYIKSFDKLNEVLIDWDDDSTKSVVRQMLSNRGKKYSMNIKEPFTLNTTDQELFAKLKFYLNANRIPFDYTEEDL